ncbi:hypothetical protein ABZ615_33345 [Streptomyces sp. NPDC007325]|uniref:hypothetical protein n=1 Tax=Streptomyces sp. NPDC007325 TaxID=3154588 RepID=UPI0034058D5B
MTAVLQPDCRLDVHTSCRTAEVRVHGIVIVKVRRCDCPCHTQKTHAGFIGRPNLPPVPADPV